MAATVTFTEFLAINPEAEKIHQRRKKRTILFHLTSFDEVFPLLGKLTNEEIHQRNRDYENFLNVLVRKNVSMDARNLLRLSKHPKVTSELFATDQSTHHSALHQTPLLWSEDETELEEFYSSKVLKLYDYDYMNVIPLVNLLDSRYQPIIDKIAKYLDLSRLRNLTVKVPHGRDVTRMITLTFQQLCYYVSPLTDHLLFSTSIPDWNTSLKVTQPSRISIERWKLMAKKAERSEAKKQCPDCERKTACVVLGCGHLTCPSCCVEQMMKDQICLACSEPIEKAILRF